MFACHNMFLQGSTQKKRGSVTPNKTRKTQKGANFAVNLLL